MRRVRVLPRAQEDIEALVVFMECEAGTDVAARLLRALERTFDRLGDFPNRGRLHESPDPMLRPLRVVPVEDFERWLVFYRVLPSTVDVARVLHGARNRNDGLFAG